MSRHLRPFGCRPASDLFSLLGWSSPTRVPRRRRPVPVSIAVESLETRVLLSAQPVSLASAAGDPDDQISEATNAGAVTATSATGFNASVFDPTDVDMFSFTVVAGQTVSFDIDTPASSSLDSAIRVFNSSGTELAYNDDGAAPGESNSLDSYREFTFTTGGTYYLGVSNLGNRNYSAVTGNEDTSGSTGAYTVTFRNVVPPDFTDQISEAISAGVISGNSTIPGAVDTPTDVDIYSFTVAAGQQVGFDIDRTGGSTLDSFIRLFNSSGTQLTSNDDGQAPDDPSFTTESYLEFTFTVGGTYYLGVSGFGNFGYNPVTGDGDGLGSTGGYNLSFNDLTPPDLDDQLSEATDLGGIEIVRQVLDGSIDRGSDVDLYRFTARAGQDISFDIDRPDNSLDSYLRLFDAAGNELAFNDDGNAPGEPADFASYLEFTFNTTGAYYIGVSGLSNTNYNPINGGGDVDGSTGDYRLIVSPIDLDDQLVEANFLGALGGVTQVNNEEILFGSDVDLFEFSVFAGQRVLFDLDRPAGGGLDSYIRLFNSGGGQIAANDDGAAPGEPSSLESFLAFTFTTAGTYYLGVSGFSNTLYNSVTGGGDSLGDTGAYSLVLTADSANDPDDQFSEALNLGSLTAQLRISGAISTGTDVDMIRFNAAAGQRVFFDIDNPAGSGLDSFVRLFNSAGTQIAANDDAAGPGEGFTNESFLAFTFNTAGTYYLGVSGFGNSAYNPINGAGDQNGSAGDYVLVVTPAQPPGDPDDQFSEALNLGSLTAQRRISGAISPGTDVDMIRFTAAAGQRVFFDIDNTAGSGLDSYLRLFNSAGTQIAANDDGAGPGEGFTNESFLTFTFNTAGTYYLGVSGFGNSAYNPINGAGDQNGSTGGYVLVVTPAQPPGDPDDQFSEALNLGSLTAQLRISGAISTGTDVDMIRFNAAAGQRVFFDIDNPASSGLDSFVRLFNSSGTQIAANDDGAGPGEGFTNESFLAFTFNTAGTYYLGVSGFGNSVYNPINGAGDQNGSTGGYVLVVTPAQPPGDPDDQFGEAFNIGTVNGQVRITDAISPATDVDIVRFNAFAGQRIFFDIDRTGGSGLDSFLRLFDGRGTQIAANDDAPGPGESFTGESFLAFTFSQTGAYFLGVSGFGNSTYNPFNGTGDQAGSSGGYVLVITPAQQLVAPSVVAAAGGTTTPTARGVTPQVTPGQTAKAVTAASTASVAPSASLATELARTVRAATVPVGLDDLFAGDLIGLLVGA